MQEITINRKLRAHKLFDKLSIAELREKADFVRKDVLEICTKNGAGHIAPSLSCVDIMVSLYYNIMNLSQDPEWEDRDRLVFSKAHGCYGLYSILADVGYLKRKDWESFYKGSFLTGCVERELEFGIEASCGSLGHGLPMAVGIAFGAKMQGKKYRTYCIVGDGEMQEGSNWEAMQVAVMRKLDNLTVVIDQNNLQAMDFLDNILTPAEKTDDLERKFEAFGFKVEKCDGHNMKDVTEIFEKFIENKDEQKRPQVMIAKTIKGYGAKCMENVPKFHFRVPTEEELRGGE